MPKAKINKWEKEFVEKGANLEHQRWANWQSYLFSKCNLKEGINGLIIPIELAERWERQTITPYDKLSEQEKESDRKEARKYLPLIRQLLQSQQKEKKEDMDWALEQNTLQCHQLCQEELKTQREKRNKTLKI